MKKKILVLIAAVTCVLGAAFINSDDTSAKTIICTGAGNGSWPKEYCAGELYRNDTNNVKTTCRGSSADQGKCRLYVNNNTTCAGIPTSSCSTAKSSFVDGVTTILTSSTNLDPCGSMQSGEEQNKCKKTNWKYYYKAKPSDKSSSTDDPDGGGDSDSGDGDDDGSSESSTSTEIIKPDEGACATILSAWCSKGDTDGEGIKNLIKFVADILTGAVVVAGTVGLVICGVLWMTARENEAQVATAKRRMLDIVIGMVAWILVYALANLFIPKNEVDIKNSSSIVMEIKK